MKKILMFFALLAMLLLVGKFVLEYQYRQKLDDVVKMASLYAYVYYEDLNIGLDGSINVKSIIVRKNDDDTEMRIAKVRLFSSDRLFLLKGFDVFTDGKLPDSSQVNVSGFEFDDGFMPELGGTPNCSYFQTGIMAGQTSPFMFNGNRSDFDIVLNARDEQAVNLSYNFEMQDAYLMNSSATIDANAISDLDSAVAMQSVAAKGDLPINQMDFSMKLDPQFANQFLSYCAEKLGLSVQEYQSTIMNSDEYYRRLDLVPSAQLKQAIQRFFAGESELNFRSSPSELGKNFRRLSVYQPKQIAKFLNLKVTIDGQEVTPLFNDLEQGDAIESAKTRTVEKNQKFTSVASARNAREKSLKKTSGKRQSELKLIKEAKKAKYRKVRLADAQRYIGRDVRVKRRGRLLEGRLISWGEKKAVLERQRYGGRTEMPLQVDEIVGLEVIR